MEERMTIKAQRILEKLKRKNNKILQEFNQSTLDAPATVGGPQEMTILNEMNELQQFENENWGKGTV
jgi:hypothetical protein